MTGVDSYINEGYTDLFFEFDNDDSVSLRSVSGIDVRDFKFMITPEQINFNPDNAGKPIFSNTSVSANVVVLNFSGGSLNAQEMPWGDVMNNLEVFKDGISLENAFAGINDVEALNYFKACTESLEAQGITTNDNLSIVYNPRARDWDHIKSVDGTFAINLQQLSPTIRLRDMTIMNLSAVMSLF